MVGEPVSPLELKQWLVNVGFLDNPFDDEAFKAERDEYLPDCFIEFPYYAELLGRPGAPGPRFVFARRGAGKSTLRLQIQGQLEEKLSEGTRRALTVTYDEFEDLRERVNGDVGRITRRMHIEQIAGRIVDCLFDLGVREKPLVDLCALGANHRPLFRWYVDRFSRCLQYWQLKRRLDRVEGIFNFVSVEEILRGAQVVSEDLRGTIPEAEVIVNTLNEIVRWRPLPVEPTDVPDLDLLTGLVEICQALGLDEVVVLVDRVDEPEYTGQQYDFEPAFQLIRPLGAAIDMLRLPHFVIKFFLPAEVLSQADAVFRFDLFKERLIEWDQEALAQILERRLQVFSNRVYSSLAPLCEEALQAEIDQLLVGHASTPRELLQLGNELLTQHFRFPSDEPLLTTADWQRALQVIQARRRRQAHPQQGEGPPFAPPIDRNRFFELLNQRFSVDELRQVCFVLDIDYESLPGEGKLAKARELIAYAQRRGRFNELVRECRKLRPDAL